MLFLCFWISSINTYWVYSSCLLRLFLAVTFSQTFLVFLTLIFLGVLGTYFIEYTSTGICLMFFSWLDWGCRFGKEDHRGKLKMDLPFDPAIPLPGIYPKQLKTLIRKNIYHPMFIAVLFTVADIWKQPSAHK